jgi:hypothetical protein
MGKLLEFPKVSVICGETGEPKAGKLIEFRYNLQPEYFDAPFEPSVKGAAKSSTSVLKASICQRCGCKLDGKIESMRPGCSCLCHEGKIR